MAGVRLKGLRDLVSIMVPLEVPLKEKFSWKKSVNMYILYQCKDNGEILFYLQFSKFSNIHKGCLLDFVGL